MTIEILAAIGAVGIAAALAYALIKTRTRLNRSQADLSKLRDRFSRVLDIEEEVKRTEEELKSLRLKRTSTRDEVQKVKKKLASLQDSLAGVQDELAMEAVAHYQPVFDFDDPEEYKAKRKTNREQQRDMIRGKIAAVCSTTWQVEGSTAKGEAMANRQLRLMLRAFNGECDAAIAKVRFTNVHVSRRKIESGFKAINKMGVSMNCHIADRYLDLKVQELLVVFELRERQQEIKEEQARIKREMREQAQAEREIRKAQEKAEREERQYNAALEKARKEVEDATGAAQSRLERKIGKLEERLAEAQANKERALSRAQLTKSGHVYIVSNIGSFGQDIYKIGMTRRLIPMDRVKELSDASVPFPFDVHAMIYSEEAPALENALHKALDERRINKVNLRKEFFEVKLEDIEREFKKAATKEDLTFIRTALAEEYRKTKAVIEERAGRSPITVA